VPIPIRHAAVQARWQGGQHLFAYTGRRIVHREDLPRARREAMAATSVGLDAAGAALLADELLADGESLQSVWRYVIVQLVDDYSHDLARVGVSVASRRFDREPPVTRAAEVDAALAALAEYLARRDNWTVPSWARKPGRYSRQVVVRNAAAGNACDRSSGVSFVLPYQGSLHHFGHPEPGMTAPSTVWSPAGWLGLPSLSWRCADRGAVGRRAMGSLRVADGPGQAGRRRVRVHGLSQLQP